MSNLKKKLQLVCCEVGDKNANKVWEGELYEDDLVITRWGRIGTKLDFKEFPRAGESFLNKKEREKLRRGYTPSKTVASLNQAGATTTTISNLQLIARQELARNHPELSKLIDRLVQANIHNITSQTNITFNSTTGLFQTPLGIVTLEGIDEARNLLVEIKKALISRKKALLAKLVSGYLCIVPQKVGRQLTIESIFPDLDAVQKQSDVLDSLEASYKAMTAAPVIKNSPVQDKTFQVEMDVLQDNKEIRRLEDFYTKTMKSTHGYGHIKVQRMFSVRVNEMDRNYDNKLGNNVEVYHGTSQANLLSILKSGLKTAPPSTAYIAGKMFGNGIYGAINSSKSLGYTFGRWGGSSSGDSGWLFVCDFAMGKPYEPSGSCSAPISGYDSVWAKASKAGLCHDELIVYRNNQVKIKYLLECK